MTFYDPPGQQQRRLRVLAALKERTLSLFDPQGKWLPTEFQTSGAEPGLRERLWFAQAFLADGDERAVRVANRIIATSPYRFCHFSPMIALQLLVKHDTLLETDARAALTGYLEWVLDEFLGGDVDFVGVNDNFPCMSIYTALVGGKLFARPDLYETGVKRLSQFKALLTRRGVDTEYTSPTYTPIHAYALAEIANTVDDPVLRDLALQCEERIWVDLLGHYHPPTSQIAGPYSRAYTVDSTGRTHQARYVLYALLGERLTMHPLNTLFAAGYGDDPRNLVHGGLWFMLVSVAWLVNTEFHCPVELVDALVTNKTYPANFKATMEYGPSSDAPADTTPGAFSDLGEYAAGHGSISTFMTEDYALGIATGEFHAGTQTDAFHLLYRRRIPAARQADINTVYARYLINGKRPGQTNAYPAFSTESGESLLWDEGRKLGLHHERTAMMLYKPKRFGRKNVERLELAVIVPAQFGPPEEIWLGERQLAGQDGSSAAPCPVFLKDGPVYLAFHPLLLTDHGREVAVQVRLVNGYLLLSFLNYQGPARDFAVDDFLLTGNGFVVEVASEREVGSFAAFRAAMGQVHTHDELFTCVHYRWAQLRRTAYKRGDLRLACEYSPVTEGIKYQAVNGRVPETPLLEVTGLDRTRLPFLGTGAAGEERDNA